jgi:hypothetical protein
MKNQQKNMEVKSCSYCGCLYPGGLPNGLLLVWLLSENLGTSLWSRRTAPHTYSLANIALFGGRASVGADGMEGRSGIWHSTNRSFLKWIAKKV